ncbi:MAG: prolipoprotein diacylglyceryl transferase, partial [Oscillospiraceae bacterium]|nr:prolipoprotein diacylglyceryl transferase [Oscillospiraceae bacterium]
ACVHPTFLYESLWNATGFVILHFYSKHRRFDGEVFWLYVLWYGIGRAIIEGLRTDSLYFFGTGIRTSQALALITAIAAVIVLVYNYKRIKSEVKTNECSNN